MNHSNLTRFKNLIAVLTLITGTVWFYSCGTSQNVQNSNDYQPLNSVAIDVDLNQRVGEMTPLYAWIGYDEPNYTYLSDGRELLSEFADLSPVPVYVRAHNLLMNHDGSPYDLKWGSTDVYSEDEDGNPVYDWEVMDRIFDTWIDRGMKPLVEIGFLPKALADEEPYRHHWTPGDPYSDIWTGWSYPPNDYDKWAELIYQWVNHSVDRYGADEVETWYWQLWNEPDATYWRGTLEEFNKLHDYTADAIRRALPTAQIGGPHTTGAYADWQADFFRGFLEHCSSGTNYVTGETGCELDFIGFHAKGSPQVTDDGHVRMRMSYQLRQIAAAFDIINEFPEFRDLPVVIGESDPEGCAACGRHFGYPQMDYRNGTMFSSYTASSFAKKYELIDETGVNLVGAMSWTFTFPDQPLFSGFRSFSTTHNINKPVMNVMRMYGMMGGDRVAVESRNNPYTARSVIDDGVLGEPDVNGLGSLEGNTASVMVWNYHDDDVYNTPAKVNLNIENIPASRVQVYHYRIDETHSNAFTLWQEMGAPQQLSRNQLVTLRQAGQLEMFTSPKWIDISNGTGNLAFELPHQGVSLVQLIW